MSRRPWFRKLPPAPVLGQVLRGPRLTWRGGLLAVAVVGLPVTLLGLLLDALVQWALGSCIGLWCGW